MTPDSPDTTRAGLGAHRPGRPVITLLSMALILGLGPGPASAGAPGSRRLQQRESRTSRSALELDQYPRHRPEELAPRHRDFIERIARWIITPDEREVFLRLPNAERRDAFIREFWRHRDPTPGTRRNEYRDLHMKRLAYATKFFGRGATRPGWMTDRGRIYILLGEPRTVNRFPNTQLAYPVEYWFYGVDSGLQLPGFFYVMFFKQNGLGDYRLYSPLSDGPEALLNPAGQHEAIYISQDEEHRRVGRPTPFGDLGSAAEALRGVDTELSQVALSLIPASGAGRAMSPVRSEMLLAEIEDLPHRIMPDASWAFAVLTGTTESNVRFETLPLQADAVALIDPSGGMFVHYALRAKAARLNLVNYQDTHAITFSLSDSLSDAEGRLLDTPEPRQIEVPLEQDMSEGIQREDLTIIDRLPAIPGRYTLGLVLENNVSREFGRAEIDLDVPRPNPAQLGASKPLLVADRDDLGDDYDPFGPQFPFQIGRNFLLPAMSGPIPGDGTLWVFQQIYVPPSEAGQRAARYELISDADTLVATKSTVLPLERKDRFGVLNQLTGIPLSGVAPGTYSLRIVLDLSPEHTWNLPVQIVPASQYRRPLVQAEPKPAATDIGLLLQWAREFRTVGQMQPAIAAAGQALDREPDSDEALELVSELLLDAGQLERLVEVLQPHLVRRPNDLPVLRQLAEVSVRLGRHQDAIRYYERARIAGAEDTPTLLNSLAGEYLEVGINDRARQYLERSLQIQPDQPALRELLQNLQDGASEVSR